MMTFAKRVKKIALRGTKLFVRGIWLLFSHAILRFVAVEFGFTPVFSYFLSAEA